MSYTPPARSLVDFNFASADTYSAPSRSDIDFNFSNLKVAVIGQVTLSGQVASVGAGAALYPGIGQLTLTGMKASFSNDAIHALPAQGGIDLSGQFPSLAKGFVDSAHQGDVAVLGQVPALANGFSGISVHGSLAIIGGNAKHSSYAFFGSPGQADISVVGQSASLALGSARLPIQSCINLTGQAPVFADRVLVDIPSIWLATQYRCYLTGTENGLSDLELPISSFQTRINSESTSYLSVVLKGADHYVDEIALRDLGRLRIWRIYVLADGSTSNYLMADVLFEEMNLSLGGRSGMTAQITGTDDMVPYTAQSITLYNPSYYALSGGKRRYRCEIDPRLRPGDTVAINNESFIVGGITHIVDTSFASMEIAEA